VAFRQSGPAAKRMDSSTDIIMSVDESTLLAAGPDSGHFNGLSAGQSADKGHGYQIT
jgi:hypothetical protein